MKNKKIISIAISLILVAFVFCGCTKRSVEKNPCAAPFINQQMKDMLHGIKRVDSDGYLYKMDYTYDYYDESITNIISNMNAIDSGCSAFTTYNEENEFMFCRNYDYNHLDKNGTPSGLNVVIVTQPKNKLKSISVCDAYWLDSNNYFKGVLDDGKTDLSNLVVIPYMCVDGMNEAGVSVALFAVDTKEGETSINQDTGKTKIIHSVLLRYILDNAHNLNEAISLAESYDIVSSAQIDLHMMISDKNGNSAVFEWRQYGEETEQKLKVTYTNVITNFFVGFDDAEDMYYEDSTLREKFAYVEGTINSYNYGYGHGYHRFNGIVSALDRYTTEDNENEHGVFNAKMLNSQAMNILSVAAQEPGLEKTSLTQYSALYNLDKGILTIYSERNYNKSYSFNLS